MFSLFQSKKNDDKRLFDPTISDFDYLRSGSYYFDSACQTLRPNQVITAEIGYYYNYNSCGHRVKYKWGQETDRIVAQCRRSLLDLTKKKQSIYTVAFCLNTTHGINLILQQIDNSSREFGKIITSDIEHNSVFLTSLTFARRSCLERIVLDRDKDGSLIYEKKDLQKAIVILNTQSNIDGRELRNVKQLAKDVHEMGGILLLDGCQTFGHDPEILADVDFDAVFGSGHKMYGPSIGFIIIKKELVKKLDCFLIGGSTVQDVKLDHYTLIENEDELYARIESGLQNYAGIVGLNKAIEWKKNKLMQNIDGKQPKNAPVPATQYEQSLSLYLNQKLTDLGEIFLLNTNPSPVVSLYSKKMDGHKIAVILSEAGIMGRSGYHCCHYYLREKLNLPPLFRISLGLNNTPGQIDYLIEKLKLILS